MSPIVAPVHVCTCVEGRATRQESGEVEEMARCGQGRARQGTVGHVVKGHRGDVLVELVRHEIKVDTGMVRRTRFAV